MKVTLNFGLIKWLFQVPLLSVVILIYCWMPDSQIPVLEASANGCMPCGFRCHHMSRMVLEVVLTFIAAAPDSTGRNCKLVILLKRFVCTCERERVRRAQAWVFVYVSLVYLLLP